MGNLGTWAVQGSWAVTTSALHPITWNNPWGILIFFFLSELLLVSIQTNQNVGAHVSRNSFCLTKWIS